MIKVISTVRQLEGLERDWRELEAVSGVSPFSTYAWNRTWWTYFGDGRPMIVLAAYEGGSLVGIAPFYITGNAISKRLEFIGNGRLADYNDFLIRPGQDRTALIDRFVDQAIAIGGWHRLFLGELPAWSMNLEALSEVMAHREDLIGESVPGSVCPFIDLDSCWEAYYAGRSRKLTRDSEREERKLAGAGRLRINALGKVDDQIMDAVIGMHAPGKESVFAAQPTRDFFLEMTKRFADDQRLRLILIELDGAPIAFYYTLILGRTNYAWLTGYDSRFQRLAPGKVSMLNAIRLAFEQGSAEFDYMRGDESYKSRWATGERQSVSFDLVVNRLGDRLRSYTEQRVRPAVKKVMG